MSSLLTALETSLTFDRAAMEAVLARVQAVCPAKSPRPVLQLVRLVTDPEAGAFLEATDLEVSIRHRILGVVGHEPMNVLLPPGRFHAMLRAKGEDGGKEAKAEEVTITLMDGGKAVRIAGRRWKFDLPTEDPAGWPALPDFTAADYHAVAAADLQRAIRRTVYATDVDSTRYALGGCLIEAEPDTLAMVGTDGRRLSKQIVTAEAEGTGFPAGQAVVPVKALKLIERILDADDPPVHLTLQAHEAQAWQSPSRLLLRTDAADVSALLTEGRFPRYQDIIPASCATTVTVEAGALLDATDQARIATSDESRGIDFAFAGDLLTLSAQAADVGSGECTCPIATVGGPPVTVTLDGRYVIDCLKPLDRRAVCRIELTDPKSAVVLKTDDRFLAVLMVLTRDR